MLLESAVGPRRDGTVIARVDQAKYVFEADASGVLVCEVPDADHVAFLLETGNFYPADAGDFEVAAALIAEADTEAGNDDAAPIEEPAAAKPSKTKKDK